MEHVPRRCCPVTSGMPDACDIGRARRGMKKLRTRLHGSRWRSDSAWPHSRVGHHQSAAGPACCAENGTGRLVYPGTPRWLLGTALLFAWRMGGTCAAFRSSLVRSLARARQPARRGRSPCRCRSQWRTPCRWSSLAAGPQAHRPAKEKELAMVLHRIAATSTGLFAPCRRGLQKGQGGAVASGGFGCRNVTPTFVRLIRQEETTSGRAAAKAKNEPAKPPLDLFNRAEICRHSFLFCCATNHSEAASRGWSRRRRFSAPASPGVGDPHCGGVPPGGGCTGLLSFYIGTLCTLCTLCAYDINR